MSYYLFWKELPSPSLNVLTVRSFFFFLYNIYFILSLFHNKIQLIKSFCTIILLLQLSQMYRVADGGAFMDIKYFFQAYTYI